MKLARERSEDMGRQFQQALINPDQEEEILERLGEAVLPNSALTELRQKGIRKLLIIPDGALHYIPFAMIRVVDQIQSTQTHYLIEEFGIHYIPAMTTLETIRTQRTEKLQKRQKDRHSLLAFANPKFSGLGLTSLPDTEDEAIRAASMFGRVKHYTAPITGSPEGEAVVFTGKGACKSQVKQILGSMNGLSEGWRYILFSTHGRADSRNGMLSHIVLSASSTGPKGDNLLQAQEVLDLQLDTELVMLSACQTSLGKLYSGEGLVSLGTAFFYAGAESICASLWSVSSDATAQLVTEFFRLLKEGMDKVEALRQAQVTVMNCQCSLYGKTVDYSAPFYWAAFVLIGE